MNSKECEEQLKSLIEHFKNGGLDFNATDIKAIEHLLLENRIQQDTIKKQNQENKELKRNCNMGNENLDFYRQQYKELHNKIDKVIEILQVSTILYKSDGSRNGLFKGIEDSLKILKDSDVDE